MDKEIVKSAASSLLKNRKFYGVVVAPDGQRFKFDLRNVFQKLIEEKGKKVLDGVNANFDYGKDLYEKAKSEEEEFPAKADFLKYHNDSADSGKSSATFYLSHEVCEQALDSLKVIIYSEESKEEWQEISSDAVKYGREGKANKEKDRQIEREEAAYWRGYDEAKAEMSNKFEEERNSKKSFWSRLFG